MPQTCDVFTLLLRSCRDVQGIALEMLHLEQINVSRVETFLDYLERAARYWSLEATTILNVLISPPSPQLSSIHRSCSVAGSDSAVHRNSRRLS
jgi:hypothetical protein